jgi:CheY-like chemotaxis protein
MPDSIPSILLVEDDDDERFLAERALVRAGLTSLIHLPDGLQAKAYLETRAHAATNAPLPDIVLMDLKLPGMDGHQVLEWMGDKPEFRGLLRYVLSSSGNPQDRSRAEHAHIAGYFVKPLTAVDIETLKRAHRTRLANPDGREEHPGSPA